MSRSRLRRAPVTGLERRAPSRCCHNTTTPWHLRLLETNVAVACCGTKELGCRGGRLASQPTRSRRPALDETQLPRTCTSQLPAPPCTPDHYSPYPGSCRHDSWTSPRASAPRTSPPPAPSRRRVRGSSCPDSPGSSCNYAALSMTTASSWTQHPFIVRQPPCPTALVDVCGALVWRTWLDHTEPSPLSGSLSHTHSELFHGASGTHGNKYDETLVCCIYTQRVNSHSHTCRPLRPWAWRFRLYHDLMVLGSPVFNLT